MTDISLRDIREEDLEDIRTWRNSPEVSQYMYSDSEITAEQQQRWYQKIKDDPKMRYWIIMYEGQKMGVASVNDINTAQSHCTWTYYLKGQAVRGAGIGSKVEYHILRYVFEELKLNKLHGEVFEFNQKVVKLHERFGFRREGFLREHAFKGGEFHNIVLVGYLRSEWMTMRESVRRMVYGEALTTQQDSI